MQETRPGFLFGLKAVEEGRGSTETGVTCLQKSPVFLVFLERSRRLKFSVASLLPILFVFCSVNGLDFLPRASSNFHTVRLHLGQKRETILEREDSEIDVK